MNRKVMLIIRLRVSRTLSTVNALAILIVLSFAADRPKDDANRPVEKPPNSQSKGVGKRVFNPT